MFDEAPPRMKNLPSLRTVAEAGHTADIALIQRGFDDEDPEVRRASLGSFHRAERLTTSIILNALSDPAMTVRRRAAELSSRVKLSESERGRIVTQLGICLGQESELAEMAAFALGEIGSAPTAAPEPESDSEFGDTDQVGLDQTAIDLLINQAQNHKDAICREQAIASLGALHTGKDVILGALNDKATVRRRAVIALAPFEGDDVTAALRHALNDRDWQVRQAAEDQLGPDAQQETTETD